MLENLSYEWIQLTSATDDSPKNTYVRDSIARTFLVDYSNRSMSS